MELLSLPHIADLHHLSDSSKADALDLLFEPSPDIHATLLPLIEAQQYDSYHDLIEAARVKLLSLASQSTSSNPGRVLLSILGSHPRLGASKVESRQSAAEQDKLGDQNETLAHLNRKYEEAFPGLRYVVFVNGRGRKEIMEDMEARIKSGDFGEEVETALQAMCDIAQDRASKLPIRSAGQA